MYNNIVIDNFFYIFGSHKPILTNLIIKASNKDIFMNFFSNIIYAATAITSMLGLPEASEKLGLPVANAYVCASLDRLAVRHGLTAAQVQPFKERLRTQMQENSFNNEVEEGFCIRVLNDASEELVLGRVNKKNPIPGVLSYMPDVYYLEAEMQPDICSCGYRSVLHSIILDQIIALDRPISSESIKTAIKAPAVQTELNNIIRAQRGRWPSEAEIINYLRRQQRNLALTKIIGFFRGPDMGIYTYEQVDGMQVVQINTTAENAMNQFVVHPDLIDARRRIQLQNAERSSIEHQRDLYFTRLQNNFYNNYVNVNIPGALHFVCNITNTHWMLISIVKRRNLARPIMIILDSANWQITPQVTEYIKYLYKMFISIPAGGGQQN